MKKIMLLFTLIFVLSPGQDNVPILKWAGPPGSKPETYEQWITSHPYTEFSYTLDKVTYGGRGSVAIITEQSIANALSNELNQLTNNLQSEGHTVYSYQITGGTPETLRIFLQNLYNNNSIEGALLIGNLPVAWFEVADDFGNGYKDFPIDLFYMDLNGTWLDTMNTGNGKYDGHTGSVHPDIYIGRLYPSGLGNDTLLLQDYFQKNNSYRHDTLLLTQRALVFVDDDWIPWAGQWAGDVSMLYSDTMNYWDAETTRATVYRTKLDTIQAWVSVFAHSWPGGHQFAYNNGGSHDYYYSYEYTNQNPPTNFYNFFACSFSRYTASGNCGGNCVVFDSTSGLGSIGSTKTGSMLDFNYFYRPLGEGKKLGEAFKYWFACIYDSVGMNYDRLCWHYGMTLLADPFLIPLGHNTGIAEHSADKNISSIFTVQTNPVTKYAQMDFTLKTEQNLTISVYDCSGRKMKNITYRLGAGHHSIALLLNDKSGNELCAGIYVLKVNIDNKILTRKIVKM